MREILFRGKRKDNGEWVEGDLRHGGYVNNDSETYIMKSDYALHNIPVDPETVCQFTGLTDKNGVQVFEGNIIRGTFHGYEQRKVVCWNDRQACFEFPIWDRNEYEVIDNIFDNPELVKGGAADETD